MSFAVGIDLGTTFTGVAVAKHGGSGGMVKLGRRQLVMPSVVWLGPGNADVAVGESAVRRLASDPANVVSLFKRDVGSEAPCRVSGRDVPIDLLIGYVLGHALAIAEAEYGGRAERVALTFPASWGPLRQGVLVAGAQSAGIEEPLLVTEPEAAAAFYASERPVPDDALVAVFDFGGGTLDIAVVHRVYGGFELLGNPTGDDELGGSNIDELLFEHVLQQLDAPIRAQIDSDPSARASLVWECVDAKETLSFEPDVEVACVTNSGRQFVPVTRTQLERLIAPLVERSLFVLRSGLAAAQVEESELHSVLLVGGTSMVPMISRHLAAALSCPIAVDTDPKTSVALGAARLAVAQPRLGAAQELPGGSVDLGIPGLGPATLIGRGGYSVVYRARQTSLDRDVAVKIITGAGFDLTARRRFEQECQAIGRLSEHPNIVNVYQSGVPDDRPAFLVMSYIPGGSYQDELDAERQLTWQDAIEVGTRIARALEVAHRAGIFHCDVKPANVLISPHGEPLLADFGLARVAERTGTQSITGLAGTPHFSPPEVFDGVPPAPERDVYGLAATLHALIAGRPPIEVDSGSILALMRHIATDEPDDLRVHGVPGPVADVIAKGLAKEPGDRYPSAAEFGAALAAAGSSPSDTESRPPPPIEGDHVVPDPTGPGSRQRPDRRVTVAALGIVTVLIVGLLVARPWETDGPESATTTVPEVATTTAAESTTPIESTVPETAAPQEFTSVVHLGGFEIPSNELFGGRLFEAIDGLGYDSTTDRLLALKKTAPTAVAAADPARVEAAMFHLVLDPSTGLADGTGEDVSIAPIGVLTNAQGAPYGTDLDVEGLSVLDDGTSVVVSEGSGEGATAGPFVHRFSADGKFISAFELPSGILPSGDGASGIQLGRGPHGVTVRPGDPSHVVVVMEAPLAQDHDAADPTGEKVVRMVAFDVDSGQATREWGYALDRTRALGRAEADKTGIGVTVAGSIVDIAAVDEGSLLVLESSSAAGRLVLYRIELDDGAPPGGARPAPVEKHAIELPFDGSFEKVAWSSLTAGSPDQLGRTTIVLMTNTGFDHCSLDNPTEQSGTNPAVPCKVVPTSVLILALV